MNPYPTSRENLALAIAFELVGESRYNRTAKEYAAIAARFPPLKVLHGQINDRLAEMKKQGIAPHRVCHFKPGDEYIRYEDFPGLISIETLRSALTKAGMREPGYHRKVANR